MKEPIYYGRILVGYRLYCKGCFGLKHFIGYQWIKKNYEYYEMFIAKRKLGG